MLTDPQDRSPPETVVRLGTDSHVDSGVSIVDVHREYLPLIRWVQGLGERLLITPAHAEHVAFLRNKGF